MKKVLILGNGMSRASEKHFIKTWEDEIWVSNWAFKEIPNIKNVTRLGTQHLEVIKECDEFCSTLQKQITIYTRNKIIKECEDKQFSWIVLKSFEGFYGFSTGISLLEQALIEKYEEIYLSGFDFGGRDLYQPGVILEGSNFRKQYIQVRDKYKDNFPIKFTRIPPLI